MDQHDCMNGASPSFSSHNWQIPEKGVTNLTSDWRDGTALASLIEALRPGTVPPNSGDPKSLAEACVSSAGLASGFGHLLQNLSYLPLPHTKTLSILLLTRDREKDGGPRAAVGSRSDQPSVR
jgi:hypothetical protein